MKRSWNSSSVSRVYTWERKLSGARIMGQIIRFNYCFIELSARCGKRQLQPADTPQVSTGLGRAEGFFVGSFVAVIPTPSIKLNHYPVKTNISHLHLTTNSRDTWPMCWGGSRPESWGWGRLDENWQNTKEKKRKFSVMGGSATATVSFAESYTGGW